MQRVKDAVFLYYLFTVVPVTYTLTQILIHKTIYFGNEIAQDELVLNLSIPCFLIHQNKQTNKSFKVKREQTFSSCNIQNMALMSGAGVMSKIMCKNICISLYV